MNEIRLSEINSILIKNNAIDCSKLHQYNVMIMSIIMFGDQYRVYKRNIAEGSKLSGEYRYSLDEAKHEYFQVW